MLGCSKTPAGPLTHRPWRARLSPIRVPADDGPMRSAAGSVAADPQRAQSHGSAEPGRGQFRLSHQPKSFIYHLAAEAL